MRLLVMEFQGRTNFTLEKVAFIPCRNRNVGER